MEQLIFRKPGLDDVKEIEAFKAEFLVDGSSMDGAGTLWRDTAEEWLAYLERMENSDDPAGLHCYEYGLFREDGCLLGLLQIRQNLTEYLVDFGGHIGYCVRPSQRRKGYASNMLRRSLSLCRELGLERVMVTCLETNIGSARTIERCGGVYEKTVFDNRNYQQYMKRYWIAT